MAASAVHRIDSTVTAMAMAMVTGMPEASG
jgi:hypothetical protein